MSILCGTPAISGVVYHAGLLEFHFARKAMVISLIFLEYAGICLCSLLSLICLYFLGDWF